MKAAAAVCILCLPLLCLGHTFTASGHMDFARQGHTATLLPDGRVLVTGGKNAAGILSAAEIFNPVTGAFSRTGNMVKARVGHTATLISSGKVLIAGGQNGTGTLVSAEIFNPATGTFTRTGNMVKARVGHTATLLPNGKVLIAGGGNATAEIFDPTTGSFTTVGNMSASRTYAAAVLLANGSVLVAGGTGVGPSGLGGSVYGDVFNPAMGTFKKTASKGTQAVRVTATLLQNGKVMLNGGEITGTFCGFCGPPLVSTASSFLFDGATVGFSSTGAMTSTRFAHTSTLLLGGDVLVTGGGQVRVLFCRSGCPRTTNALAVSRAEVYSPAAGAFSSTVNMTTARAQHTATMLSSGRVLIIGGADANGNALDSSELFR